jgi:hypothetical protein
LLYFVQSGWVFNDIYYREQRKLSVSLLLLRFHCALQLNTMKIEKKGLPKTIQIDISALMN